MTQRQAKYHAGSSEHAEQAALIAWARTLAPQYPVLGLLYAIPNGAKLPWRVNRTSGQRYSLEGQKLRAEGMRPGVPDLCLPVARQGWHGLYIEMKYGNNQPSPEQVAFAEMLTQEGYLALVCWGCDDARARICEYLGIGEL